jgi:hypothetical protein
VVGYYNHPWKSQKTKGLPKWGMMSGGNSRLPYGLPMTTASRFVTDLQREQRIGNVSAETEQHLKHEFRKFGRDASGPTLAAAVEAEIVRLERQAATLRRLCAGLLDVASM